MQSKDGKLSELIKELQEAEKEENRLSGVLKRKQKKLVETISCTNKGLDMGASYAPSPFSGSLLGIYKHWYDEKFSKAESEGYMEATKLYQNKLKKLENDLDKLIEQFKSEISNHDSIINDTINELSQKLSTIARLKMEIANLNLIS